MRIPMDHQKALQCFSHSANAAKAVSINFLGKIYLERSDSIKADNDTAQSRWTVRFGCDVSAREGGSQGHGKSAEVYHGSGR
ncbi:hypothetical protein RP20_CCG016426 [Aedes albopictus]|nr:hypothetical protein RP20_CCG016426 [Aedes albopictus]